MNGIPLFEHGEARVALKKRCREAKISITTLEALVEAELEQVGKKTKRGLWEQFDELLKSPVTTTAADSDTDGEGD